MLTPEKTQSLIDNLTKLADAFEALLNTEFKDCEDTAEFLKLIPQDRREEVKTLVERISTLSED